MRFIGRNATLIAFSIGLFSVLVARQSRADDPRVDYVNIDGSHGNEDTFMWAQCPAGGQDGYCAAGDNVYYTLSPPPSVDNPVVTVTPTAAPSGYPPTVVSPGQVRWCSVAIQCHLGGGLTYYLYDEQQGGTPCHIDGFNNGEVYCDLADYIWIAVGVSQYPP
jgi:hypothetical protein